MKLSNRMAEKAFTLSEMMVALTIATLVLAGTIEASVALQKSFNAIDRYFATHMQQIRIIDYLSRDARRAYVVTTSVDLQSVTMTIPNYIIQAGDPETIADPTQAGKPRTPTVTTTTAGTQVNYGASNTTVVYRINGNAIERVENGTVTTIASSTNQLVPLSTDVELANTEYLNTNVTFLPMFTSNGTLANRTGTSIYCTAYLRNKRRG